MMLDEDERASVWEDLSKAVNMSPAALEKWLKTEDSKAVGWKDDGDAEPVGRHSGRHIIKSGVRRRRT